MRIFIILITLLLGGCHPFKRTMGLVYESPDEFTIQPHHHLKIPQEFTLPAPEHDKYNSWRKHSPDTRALLTGVPPLFNPSGAGEQALLNQLPPAEPQIRLLVNTEAMIPTDDQPLILFGQKPLKGKALDAEEELQRLKGSHEIILSGH